MNRILDGIYRVLSSTRNTLITAGVILSVGIVVDVAHWVVQR